MQSERADRIPLGAEIALAFAAGIGTFALAGVALAGIETRKAAAVLGVGYLFAVIAIARYTSNVYAVPVGMAGLLAYDWFFVPPTHPLEFPDSANLVDLLVYLGVSVLLGELAARSTRRAEAAERATAEASTGLVASRARLLTAADDARRRVVRDLHDGAQQCLVQTAMRLRLAQRALEEGDEEAKTLVAEAIDLAEQANAELRELSQGILPAALARGGLAAGVRTLVARLGLPVDVDVPGDRLPTDIEASAYFVVAEALTNVAKHARAHSTSVTARVGDGVMWVRVSDDGVGGARADGSGLLGLNDRAAALGGQLDVESPPGGGTSITVTLPMPD